MTLPSGCVASLRELVSKFADASVRVASWKEAEELCGKAGRLAQVIPEARPFCAGFYAALSGAKAAKRAQAREAPPDKVATRRFRTSAKWVLKLLVQDANAPFRLEHLVRATGPSYDPGRLRIEFDACTTGGAALLFENNEVVEYWITKWTKEDTKPVSANTGDSGSQTCWELATLVLAVVHFGLRSLW